MTHRPRLAAQLLLRRLEAAPVEQPEAARRLEQRHHQAHALLRRHRWACHPGRAVGHVLGRACAAQRASCTDCADCADRTDRADCADCADRAGGGGWPWRCEWRASRLGRASFQERGQAHEARAAVGIGERELLPVGREGNTDGAARRLERARQAVALHAGVRSHLATIMRHADHRHRLGRHKLAAGAPHAALVRLPPHLEPRLLRLVRQRRHRAPGRHQRCNARHEGRRVGAHLLNMCMCMCMCMCVCMSCAMPAGRGRWIPWPCAWCDTPRRRRPTPGWRSSRSLRGRHSRCSCARGTAPHAPPSRPPAAACIARGSCARWGLGRRRATSQAGTSS